jgi:hypothetical protein
VSTVDWHAIQDLATAHERPLATLLALKCKNDPFYLGEARWRDAEWFAALYREHGFGRGVHLRRIHYRLVSQERPIQLPLGGDYINTMECWGAHCAAAKDARYARLVDANDFIDQRNPEADVRLPDVVDNEPEIYAFEGLHIEIPDTLPNPLECPTLPYHVEIWTEKSTINDVLEPLAARYGLNLQASLGEISLTRCRELVERAAANGGRPVRVLYVSDFDPAGQSMPVATARKIERLIHDGEFSDIQLQPIVLTYDRCVEYELPRTPLKETETRSFRFEARFGEGATELDALEALHPGELRRILVREIERFHDPDFRSQWQSARWAAMEQLSEIEREILARHAGEVSDLRRRLAELRRGADEIATDLAVRNEVIARELKAAAPDVDEFDFPEPRDAAEWENPLFDSARDYVAQIDCYKEFQGKATAGKKLGRPCKAVKIGGGK